MLLRKITPDNVIQDLLPLPHLSPFYFGGWRRARACAPNTCNELPPIFNQALDIYTHRQTFPIYHGYKGGKTIEDVILQVYP